ncbi:MAG: hypothetical protein IJP48_11060 [Synergistaceae bacterium]|nr:hypothetical protein [Synergistaceae bacterium]
MTRLSRKIFLAVLLVLSITGSALAGLQNFTLYNYSGRTISRILLNPSRLPTWNTDNDLFTGRYPLGDRDSALVKINTYPDDRLWDMRVYYTNDTYEEWTELDLFEIYNIAIDESGTIYWNF